MSITIPKHSVLPFEKSDLPTIAQFLADSKTTLTPNRFLWRDWPNHAAQLKHYTSHLQSVLDASYMTSLKVVEDETGEVVGHLVMTREKPAAEKSQTVKLEIDKESSENPWPNISDALIPEFADLIGKAAGELKKPVKDHEYLSLTHIYVRPSSRNKGIGSSLVYLFLETGKQAGLPVFVISEPQARPFFSKLGFTGKGHFDIDLSEHAPKNCGYGVFRLSGMTHEA
ncbi:hypothetical protein BJ170DRAFT_681273 [Xylariales sp. AK1849]|nr:hypothetical protein BJ170DRAFT_681273 [Xylariales sp. AK1849]